MTQAATMASPQVSGWSTGRRLEYQTTSAAPATSAVEPAGGGVAPAAAAPAPIEEPPKPPPPYVAAALRRPKVPKYAIPVLAALPVWALVYAGTMVPPSNKDPQLKLGAQIFAA